MMEGDGGVSWCEPVWGGESVRGVEVGEGCTRHGRGAAGTWRALCEPYARRDERVLGNADGASAIWRQTGVRGAAEHLVDDVLDLGALDEMV